MEANIVVFCTFEAIQVDDEDVRSLIDVPFQDTLRILALAASYFQFYTHLAIDFHTIVEVVLKPFHFVFLLAIGLIFGEGFRHRIGEITGPIHHETDLSEIEVHSHGIRWIELASSTVLLVLGIVGFVFRIDLYLLFAAVAGLTVVLEHNVDVVGWLLMSQCNHWP